MAKKSVKPAAKTAAPAPMLMEDQASASPLRDLLQHIAESEHHLRHPEAFKLLVTVAGFKLVQLDHKFEVQDAS